MSATTFTVLDSVGATKTFQAEDVGGSGQLSSKVTVRESVLPTGASTETTLAALLTLLSDEQWLVNMDYTGGTTTDILQAYALAFRSNGGVQYVATNNGLPINATGTSIAILDGSGNKYLSAQSGLNGTGPGLFPSAVMGQYDDTSPTAVTENRFAHLRMSSTRELYVTPAKSAAPTNANVSSSASNVTLIAANANRKGFTIYNDSAEVLYVKFGATASTTSFNVKMAPGSLYESNAGVNYTGIIDGIWAAADGAARVGEF